MKAKKVIMTAACIIMVSGVGIFGSRAVLVEASVKEVKVSAAKAISLYKKAYPKTDITELELEKKYGTYYYKIEGMDNNKEYGVSINGKTGKVHKDRPEYLDRDERGGSERNRKKLNLSKLMTINKAGTLAQKAAKRGTAVEWKLERKLSTTYWEVKVESGRYEAEVKLHSQSGKVLDLEWDD